MDKNQLTSNKGKIQRQWMKTSGSLTQKKRGGGQGVNKETIHNTKEGKCIKNNTNINQNKNNKKRMFH
jgi:hypothetical protein